MKKVLTAVVFLICVFFIAIFAYKKYYPDGASSSGSVVAICYNLGGRGDKSYNDAAYLGVEKLQQKGVKVIEFSPSSLDEFDKGLEFQCLKNPKIVYCVGYLYADAVQRLARKYPNIVFVLLDGTTERKSNVICVNFAVDEGSALAGAVAAINAKTKIIAFIGGNDIPIINVFRDGFEKGAKFADRSITVRSYYIGAGGEAFTNPAAGRKIAMHAIDSGASVLYHAAGGSGNGVIKAAEEKGIYVIGVDVDQSHIGPKSVITSVIKRFDVALEYVYDIVNRNPQQLPDNIRMDLKNTGVSVAPFRLVDIQAAGDIVEKYKLEGNNS